MFRIFAVFRQLTSPVDSGTDFFPLRLTTTKTKNALYIPCNTHARKLYTKRNSVQPRPRYELLSASWGGTIGNIEHFWNPIWYNIQRGTQLRPPKASRTLAYGSGFWVRLHCRRVFYSETMATRKDSRCMRKAAELCAKGNKCIPVHSKTRTNVRFWSQFYFRIILLF